MKQTVSTALLDFFDDNNAFNWCDLITITLANGQTICAASGNQDIRTAGSPPTIYYSTLYGKWQRGAITSEANHDMRSNSMDLTFSAVPSMLFPNGSTSMMALVSAGLMDAAQVLVQTLYWGIGQSYSAGFSLGLETKYQGTITSFKESGRSKYTFSVADPFYNLNMSFPRNVYQSGCRHTVYDPVCGLIKANFAFSTTVASGSTQSVINLASPLTNASWWNGTITTTQGTIDFTSGNCAGLSEYIKNQISTSQIQLNAPLPFALAVGDAITVYAGCAKTLPACQGFDNTSPAPATTYKQRFGGQPFIPDPEVAA